MAETQTRAVVVVVEAGSGCPSLGVADSEVFEPVGYSSYRSWWNDWKVDGIE
jgi:hypothetical protein